MKNTALLLASTLLASAAMAQNDFITVVTTDDGGVTKVKASSFTISKNKKGDEFTKAIFETQIKPGALLHLQQRYVTHHDCNVGHGKVITLDMDGNFLYENDFALGSSSVASTVAKVLCYKRDEMKRNESSENRSPKPQSNADAQWRDTIEEFFRQEVAKPDGIDYLQNQPMLNELDAIVKELGNNPKITNRSMMWYLREADRLLKSGYRVNRSRKGSV